MLGLRADEALNIKPSWFKEDLSILTYGDEGYQPKGQTTDDLDILPVLSEAKERLSRIIHGKSPEKPIFEMTNYDNLSYFFGKVAGEKFPNKYLTFHSLRKSFAMYLVNEKRLHPKELHEMMRHKDMNTTMTFYTDIDIDRLDQAINGGMGKNWVSKKDTENPNNRNPLKSNQLRLIKGIN